MDDEQEFIDLSALPMRAQPKYWQNYRTIRGDPQDRADRKDGARTLRLITVPFMDDVASLNFEDLPSVVLPDNGRFRIAPKPIQMAGFGQARGREKLWAGTAGFPVTSGINKCAHNTSDSR